MEIAPNVHMVTVGRGDYIGVYAPNVYLVTGNRRAAFIDTAHGKHEEVQAHLELWESHGRPEIAAIVLTHRHTDHTGGAGRLRDATGGELVSSDVEKEPIEASLDGVKVGRTAADGETIDLGGITLELVHAPGHTLGSMCVYHREEGVLFTGDNILGSGTTVIDPDNGDMASYLESLRRLLTYEARLIAPGHGPVINQPAAKILQLIAHRLEREAQILALIGDGRGTMDELFSGIYPELDRRLHATARRQIRAHLVKLERDGKVAQTDNDAFALR